MPTLFWDASGLAKYYAEEEGSKTVETLFAMSVPLPMVTTPWGYAETFALLRRKHSDGRLDATTFATAASALRNDMIVRPQFHFLTVSDAAIIGGIMHIQAHKINSVDAALLATLLRYARTTGEACVLVAADYRFCRAARAEGLAALNPEVLSPVDVPAFLNAL